MAESLRDRAARYRDMVVETTVTVYECSLCRDTESVASTRADGVVVYGDCPACMPRKKAARHWENLRAWSTLGQHVASRFTTLRPAPGLYAAYLHAQAFTADPCGLLTISGPAGTGKSHLAAAIARDACELMQPLYLDVATMLMRLKQTFSLGGGKGRDGRTFYDLVEHYRTVPLLVLDDLGAEHRTEFAQETLFAILHDRYNEARPTVVTTNMALGQLGERLADRLLDARLARVALVTGETRRRGELPPAGEWSTPAFDVAAPDQERHRLGSEVVICPTCDAYPCLDECPRQMWEARS